MTKVKFVDLRFTDTRGKEQHVSVPVSAFDEESSGAAMRSTVPRCRLEGHRSVGYAARADPNTAFIDPFYESRRSC